VQGSRGRGSSREKPGKRSFYFLGSEGCVHQKRGGTEKRTLRTKSVQPKDLLGAGRQLRWGEDKGDCVFIAHS